jgi:FkbM family methyltransferase
MLIKNLIKIIFGKSSNLKIDIKINKKWVGSKYGGFFIHPFGLNDTSIIYSFGIGEDITFDIELINLYNCNVFAFDPTPKSIEYINNLSPIRNFHFNSFGIGNSSCNTFFYMPKNKDHVSGSLVNQKNVSCENKILVEMKCFHDILKIYNHQKISILKMDIEGSEYDLISDILNSNIQIDQIIIEIHERFFVDGKSKTKILINLLHEFSYKLFAISDSLEELSFIKVD